MLVLIRQFTWITYNSRNIHSFAFIDKRRLALHKAESLIDTNLNCTTYLQRASCVGFLKHRRQQLYLSEKITIDPISCLYRFLGISRLGTIFGVRLVGVFWTGLAQVNG